MSTENKVVPSSGQSLATAEETRPAPVFTPEVDIYETAEALVVMADLPGVKPEDLNIKLEDDVLTLEGEPCQPAEGGKGYLVQEYRTGRYRRQFTVSEAIDREKISAKLKDGELKLVLPKAAAAKPQKIAVTGA
jgi:HSP20 family molecular chaperone IbpA